MKSLLAALLLTATSLTYADNLWITASLGSYHFERKDYCEVNPGVGIEYGDKYRLLAGTYHNSLCNTSNYAGVSTTAFEAFGLKFGAALLAITGYEKTKRGSEAVIAPLPFVAWEGKRLGANVVVIPPYDDFRGALGFQIKVRF